MILLLVALVVAACVATAVVVRGDRPPVSRRPRSHVGQTDEGQYTRVQKVVGR